MTIQSNGKLNKYLILTTATGGFILLGGLFAPSSNGNPIQQASATENSDQTQTSADSTDDNPSMEPEGLGDTAKNATNIVLVHGAYVDGSTWSKVIPILQDAGHRVIAAQLPLHSLADDVATVKRAVELLGGPAILVGHSYGGFVITNAGYNNPNVTGLVYVSAIAPDEGESTSDFVGLPSDFLAEGVLIADSGGFLYVNQTQFPQAFAQDVNATEAGIMAAIQKPINQSIFAEKSGPPAWKQLPTWYQISESDRLIPPDTERRFAERINATTISLNSSHAAPASHPDEIAELILDAARESGR